MSSPKHSPVENHPAEKEIGGESPAIKSLLIIGNRGGSNIGESFERAAQGFGLPVSLLESRRAMEGPAWLRRFKWHVLGKRPTRMAEFGKMVTAWCEEFRPKIVLTTGLAPLSGGVLNSIRNMGACCVNYLTDDPWNPDHRANWFFKALASYDCVLTPRRANIPDLERYCPQVKYLPFGYDPLLFFPEPLTDAERDLLSSDIMFAGGADPERVAWISSLAKHGFNIRLHGDYWERYPQTRNLGKGPADIALLRKIIAASRVALCLVRRANRDGHSMRTYEVPAVGACMLVEKTDDHSALFGPDGSNVTYFSTADEMVEKLKWLLGNAAERERLAARVHQLIARGHHTYRDRLAQMYELPLPCL
jgi:hypothetical protein